MRALRWASETLTALTVAGLLAICFPAFAGVLDKTAMFERAEEGAPPMTFGSGVFIAYNKVLTAKHVPQGEDLANIRVRSADGDIVGVKSVKEIEGADLAVVTLEEKVTHAEIAKLSCVMPKRGTPIIYTGHPEELKWMTAYGRVTGYTEVLPEMIGEGYDSQKLFVVSGGGGHGHSGGPAFDENQRVLGIVSIGFESNGWSNWMGFAPVVDHCKEIRS